MSGDELLDQPAPVPGQLRLDGISVEVPDDERRAFEGPGYDTPSEDDRDGTATLAWFTLRNAVIALVVLGLAARLAALGARPLHHDESLDAWFSWRFLNGDYDGYDPVYHGPLRFYLTAAIFWVFGETETTARLLAAVSGAVVVGLPWLWRRDLGRAGVIAAVGLLAISPSMLYFSRVGREDALFLLLTFLTVLVLVSFLRTPKPWHPAAILWLLVAAMAVKESAFLTVFIFGGYLMVLIAQDVLTVAGSEQEGVSDPLRDKNRVRRYTLIFGLLFMILAFMWGEPIFRSLGVYGALLFGFMGWAIWDGARRGVEWGEVRIVRSLSSVPMHWWLTAVWSAVLLFIVLFTQFLTDFSGPGSESAPHGALRNGLTAGFEYWRGEQDTVRGDARWQYYLAVIPAYEWFVLVLSFVGIGRVLRRPGLVGQTLVWWGVASFSVHSWAGERMPWLIIHPLLPFVLLAGFGVQAIWDFGWARASRPAVETSTGRSARWRAPILIASAIGLLWTLNSSYQAAYVRGGEPQELFVQAGQATPEVPEWVDRLYLLDRLMLAEQGRHITVSIDSDVYWPYGWYLRDFPVGTYAVLDAESEAPQSDVIFLPHWDQATVGEQLTGHRALPYEHRWWWVPDFDVGAASWGRWLWDRTPWDGSEDNPSDCPGSLVGQVYIENSLAELEDRYLAGQEREVAAKPDYGGPCERPDVAALRGN